MAKELHHPETHQIDLSLVLEALSDPTRRQMVQLLAKKKELVCSEFGCFGSKTNLAYHMARLREAGITRTRLAGQFRHISLREEELEHRFPGLLAVILAEKAVANRKKKAPKT